MQIEYQNDDTGVVLATLNHDLDPKKRQQLHPASIAHDPSAPYDGYDESDDTREKARSAMLRKQDMKIIESI